MANELKYQNDVLKVNSLDVGGQETSSSKDNPEYVSVVTDSDGRILEGILKDGTKVLGVLKSPTIDSIQEHISNIEEHNIEYYANKYRYICLTFTNGGQKLNLLGSNDMFENSHLIKTDVFEAKLGFGTMRDPSWVYFKGYYYITYNVNATKTDPLHHEDGFDEIGFCRTRDFNHFEELPHVHLSDSNHSFNSGIWAPCFCVMDSKLYIVTWCKTTDNKNGVYVFDYDIKQHKTTYVAYLPTLQLDSHIYKINGSYYAIGGSFNGITIDKASSINGTWTCVKGSHDPNSQNVWMKNVEGAYLMKKDDGCWRLLLCNDGINGMRYVDSLTSDIEGEWQTNATPSTFHGYKWDEEHFTIIDMFNINDNTFE